MQSPTCIGIEMVSEPKTTGQPSPSSRIRKWATARRTRVLGAPVKTHRCQPQIEKESPLSHSHPLRLPSLRRLREPLKVLASQRVHHLVRLDIEQQLRALGTLLPHLGELLRRPRHAAFPPGGDDPLRGVREGREEVGGRLARGAEVAAGGEELFGGVGAAEEDLVAGVEDCRKSGC